MVKDRIFLCGMCFCGQSQNVSRRNMRKCIFMDNDRWCLGGIWFDYDSVCPGGIQCYGL